MTKILYSIQIKPSTIAKYSIRCDKKFGSHSGGGGYIANTKEEVLAITSYFLDWFTERNSHQKKVPPKPSMKNLKADCYDKSISKAAILCDFLHRPRNKEEKLNEFKNQY